MSAIHIDNVLILLHFLLQFQRKRADKICFSVQIRMIF